MMTLQRAEDLLGVSVNDELFTIEAAYNERVRRIYADRNIDDPDNAEFRQITAAYAFLKHYKERGITQRKKETPLEVEVEETSPLAEFEEDNYLVDACMEDGHVVISLAVIFIAFINTIIPHRTSLGTYGSRLLFGIFLIYFGFSVMTRWRKVNWALIKPSILLTFKHSSLFHVGALFSGISIMCFKLLDQLIPTWLVALVLLVLFIYWRRKLKGFTTQSYGQPLALHIACALWSIVVLCYVNELGHFQAKEEKYNILTGKKGGIDGFAIIENSPYNDAIFFRFNVSTVFHFDGTMNMHLSHGLLGWQYCDGFYEISSPKSKDAVSSH